MSTGRETSQQPNVAEVSRPYIAGYLADYPELQPERILGLPHIPRMIGYYSHNSIASPGSFMGIVEDSIAQRYPDALQQTFQLIKEHAGENGDISVLLIPDITHLSVSKYTRYLGRLAQDTGKIVAIVEARPGEEHTRWLWRNFSPPTAASAVAYWQAKTGEHDRRKTQKPRNHTEEIVGVVSEICEEFQPKQRALQWIGGWITTINVERCLYYLKPTDVPHIQKIPAGQSLLTAVHALAYGKETAIHPFAQMRARSVLSRMNLGKEDALRTFDKEMQEKQDEEHWYWMSQWTSILGAYMQHDSALRTKSLKRLESANVTDNLHTIRHLAHALCQTDDVRVGRFISRFMDGPYDDHTAHDILFRTAVSCVQPYVDKLQLQEPSLEQQAVLAILEEKSAHILQKMTSGKLPSYKHEVDNLARVLIQRGRLEYSRLVRQFVLYYFERSDSLIDDGGFESLYISYRKSYGDIPEILQHITVNNAS